MPFWAQLFAQFNISTIQNTIFGTSSMILGVFAEISQLLKSAATQHLPQQQKQPINRSFLLSHHRFHTVLLSTVFASWQLWVQPNCGCPVMHGALMLRNKARNFAEILLQIKSHLEFPLASLALNFPCDCKDLILQEVAEGVYPRATVGGPWEWWRDDFTLFDTTTNAA